VVVAAFKAAWRRVFTHPLPSQIGDLKETLDFYTSQLGMHVHRHEEFASGCEATCNGPYGGAWSKTMCGYGGEDENFALEVGQADAAPGMSRARLS
jgi:catechol 2,3-dioxygenase-like lactoylglutathione lyase family enzyme